MAQRWRWCLRTLVSAVGFVAVSVGPQAVSAQEWDPAATITAYSTALNAHDLAAALALFDQYGSATDAHGRNFEGRTGLTAFLLANGFGNSDARISTQHLQVVANRALWTYRCTCEDSPTDVRIVMNGDKISVFAIFPPPASPTPPASRPDLGVLMWLAGLALVVSSAAYSVRRKPSQVAPPRPAQGHLIAALMQARHKH